MTTIAFDGYTMAADRCSWSGATRRQVRKLFRIRRAGREFVVAFAGSGSYAWTVLRWMRGEGERPNPLAFHEHKDLNQQCAVAVDERRRVWVLGNELIWTPVRERIFAHGGGQDFAWGALEAGATARQAVLIAQKRSDYAGFGADVMRIK